MIETQTNLTAPAKSAAGVICDTAGDPASGASATPPQPTSGVGFPAASIQKLDEELAAATAAADAAWRPIQKLDDDHDDAVTAYKESRAAMVAIWDPLYRRRNKIERVLAAMRNYNSGTL